MSSIVQPVAASAVGRLTERCKLLGLPLWHFGDRASVIDTPAGWGPPDHWLRSPLLARWIGDVVYGRTRPDRAGFVEIFPGCWIVPLGAHRPEEPMTAVMALSSEALETEQFLAVCTNGQLDARFARTAMTPLARWRRSDCERLTRILQWQHEDLRQCDAQYELIRGFSEQLTSTYEQLTHLYEISRAINRLSEPNEFVQMACARLHQALGFQWTALVVVGDAKAANVLSRTLVVSGDIPFTRQRLENKMLELGLSSTDQRVLLDPDDDELAAVIGAEVIVEPIVSGDEVVGAIFAGNKRGDDSDVSSIDFLVMRATAEYLGSFFHSVASFQEQRTMFLGTIRAITYTIEAKDRYTRGHSERVAHLASQLAIAAGTDPETVPRIRLAGMLHDVGKIGVPESILRKPGKLSSDEIDAVKRHPLIGYTILRDIGPLQDILPGVLHHHERWDGGGYPQGLAGERIPYIARILAVADTFDAMCSERAYRAARPRTHVVREIASMAGTQLDPELTRIFLTLDHGEYDAMIAKHLAQDHARM